MKLGGFNWVNQTAIGPSNEQTVDVAQNTLNNVISRANKQLVNALEVDGIRIFLYRRVLGGSPCPCSRQRKVVRDYEGTKNQLSNGATFELSAGADDGYNANLNAPDPDPLHDLSEEPGQINDVLNKSWLSEEERLLIGGAGGSIDAEGTACGICMNTKRTQGYALFHGERILLCASNDYPLSIDDSSFSEELPQGFILSEGSTVTWDVELPTYSKAESVAAFDNRKRSHNVGVWFSSDGGGKWEPLTKHAINSRHGKPKKWKIRAKQFDATTETHFTHISLILVDGKLPKAQVPNLNQDAIREQFAPLITQSWTFPPTMFNIERESVFYDSKYGFLWKVTGVYQQKTTTGQIFGYQVTARIIQPSEVYWPLQESMLSTMDVAFRGLEQYQGGAIVEENSRINRPMLDRVPAWTPYQTGLRGEIGNAADSTPTSDTPASNCTCASSYDRSPTGPDNSSSGASGNQVVCTLHNCVDASASSTVPGTVETGPVGDMHLVSLNNGDPVGNGEKAWTNAGEGGEKNEEVPFSPETPQVDHDNGHED